AFAWPMIVRTAVMDELTLRAIKRDGVDTVLNLAAGLDTRPYRLPLAPSLRWIEVDFPDVIAYKKEQLAGERPMSTLEHVGIDLTDQDRRRALFARVGGGARTMRGAWFWNLIGRFMSKAKREEGRRFSGIVLLQRR